MNIMPPARLSPSMVPFEGCEEPIEGVAEGDVECNELVVSDSVLVGEPKAENVVSRATENGEDALLVDCNRSFVGIGYEREESFPLPSKARLFNICHEHSSPEGRWGRGDEVRKTMV